LCVRDSVCALSGYFVYLNMPRRVHLVERLLSLFEKITGIIVHGVLKSSSQ
jgi:hypothetical protein